MYRAAARLSLIAALVPVVSLTAGAGEPRKTVQGSEDAWITLRVTEVRGDVAIVDRGARDGLREGDRVLLAPPGGGALEGEVVNVEERSAEVRSLAGDWNPEPGMRGEAWVPAERLKPRPALAPGVAAGQLPWETQDQDWKAGMPLLTEVRTLKPEERESTFTGRASVFGDGVWATEDGRSSGFYRLGTDLRWENPFGRGGGMRFDGEFNTRYANLPDQQGESEDRLRIDRVSYYRGGTRFRTQRWEVGRFLQNGMAEFGVLDGGEWSWRGKTDNRWGVSGGYMPEPNLTMRSGVDTQLAAFYEWNEGPQQRLSASAGFQKTWHNGTPDRDLFVTRFRFLPVGGWRFHATASVDYYSETDPNKNKGLELTQLVANAGHRWAGGTSLDFTLSHYNLPELLRNEYKPVEPAELTNAANSRLLASARYPMGGERTLHGVVGGWVDQTDSGVLSEAGLEQRDLFTVSSRADLTLYLTQGKFSTVAGMRAIYGAPLPGGLWGGRWNALYDFGNNRMLGFSATNDDLLQHRLRGSLDFDLRGGWTVSAYLQGLAWDDSGAVSAGFYVTKAF